MWAIFTRQRVYGWKAPKPTLGTTKDLQSSCGMLYLLPTPQEQTQKAGAKRQGLCLQGGGKSTPARLGRIGWGRQEKKGAPSFFCTLYPNGSLTFYNRKPWIRQCWLLEWGVCPVHPECRSKLIWVHSQPWEKKEVADSGRGCCQEYIHSCLALTKRHTSVILKLVINLTTQLLLIKKNYRFVFGKLLLLNPTFSSVPASDSMSGSSQRRWKASSHELWTYAPQSASPSLMDPGQLIRRYIFSRQCPNRIYSVLHLEHPEVEHFFLSRDSDEAFCSYCTVLQLKTG